MKTHELLHPGPRAVGLWLLAVAGMILLMVVVGGLTRLTGSGLSIMVWDPIVGALPPLSGAEWQRVFHLYRQIPQYAHEHAGMTLAAFKGIFWWEWAHRLLGRLIGVAFFVPFLWFAWRGAIGRAAIPRMVILFVLGGLQGFVGWWMVESGFENRDSVSQYRLAIHLGVALILFAAILWTAFEYLRPRPARAAKPPRLANWALALCGLIYAQMLLGSLVAGLHAGLVYNTWPDMDGMFFPEGAMFFTPWYVNFFDNAALAQFDHRMVAYAVLIGACALWLAGRRARLSGMVRASADMMLLAAAAQVMLGIFTLINQVPIPLAAAHQAMAVILFGTALWQAYELRGTGALSPTDVGDAAPWQGTAG
ncbi:MAG TPA: COX15/CtaA family protein [Rhizomicrobium sp.]|nr:COX15/CtaA family protein [Rhizomicrobium sp.]